MLSMNDFAVAKVTHPYMTCICVYVCGGGLRNFQGVLKPSSVITIADFPTQPERAKSTDSSSQHIWTWI